MDDVAFRFERNNHDEMRTLLNPSVSFPIEPLDGVGRPIDGPGYTICSDEVILRSGFRWNGASGPTIDAPWTEEASAVHDCLYDAMRAGDLGMENRVKADWIFYKILKRRGMWWPRRVAWWAAVRVAGRGWMELVDRKRD